MDDGRDQPATLPVRIISANCPSACSMTTWGDARIGAGASAADDRQGEAFSRQGEVSSGLDSSAWHWDDCKTSPSSARSGLGVAGLAVVFPAAVSATAGWLTVNRRSTIGDGCALPFSVAFNRVKTASDKASAKTSTFFPCTVRTLRSGYVRSGSIAPASNKAVMTSTGGPIRRAPSGYNIATRLSSTSITLPNGQRPSSTGSSAARSHLEVAPYCSSVLDSASRAS